jgi:hypothetical protein
MPFCEAARLVVSWGPIQNKTASIESIRLAEFIVACKYRQLVRELCSPYCRYYLECTVGRSYVPDTYGRLDLGSLKLPSVLENAGTRVSSTFVSSKFGTHDGTTKFKVEVPFSRWPFIMGEQRDSRPLLLWPATFKSLAKHGIFLTRRRSWNA